ncbi:4'-phosphopantetheinyl transferase family protein [Marinobacter orientalis]|uniref:Enterobactin synthase component D n=1 Tax=Marinobacter orientalis TaxID=1928859 RepID=A0A7Y0RD93_9GAMM|nr:4'-phosphopantetheinyl transferase superfamily protein [Marinobacter orientalis]NMT64099.1 4'-phosphopantetheinyl transferase superfamily protein [Marinobacter orientalis]TGX49331.1 4'-phosphopantetheinyl transferase superfamily protein [Marinobacter orientalis]
MNFLPACCSRPEDRWPWSQSVPGLHLIALDFESGRFEPDDFARSDILPPPSVERAVSKRQAEYLAGRFCAREGVLRATGRPDTPAQGSDRAPVWPTGCVGSITHTRGRAAAVVGQQQHYAGLGLDAEIIMTDDRALPLSRQILTRSEQARFRSELASQAGFFVTLVFCLKETLFKALYPLVQRRFYFEHAELLAWHPDGTASLRLLTTLSPAWPSHTGLEARFVQEDDRLMSLIAIPAYTTSNHSA